VVHSCRRYEWSNALACSATSSQLMLATHLKQHPRPPKKKQALSLKRSQLRQLVEWLARSSAQERIEMRGLDPRREDLALPTGIVLLTWMESCGMSQLRFATGSLREGLVIDHLLRHHEKIRKIEDPWEAFSGMNGDSLSFKRASVLLSSLAEDSR